jgi:hypothetical protein
MQVSADPISVLVLGGSAQLVAVNHFILLHDRFVVAKSNYRPSPYRKLIFIFPILTCEEKEQRLHIIPRKMQKIHYLKYHNKRYGFLIHFEI